MANKTVQIDWDLFLDIYDYFFSDKAPEEYEANEIRKKISEKVDKIINRELFTKYKRAPTGAEREAARKEYLDHKGILQSFRTDIEYPNPEPPEEKY